MLDRHGFIPSMSGKGNCYDNAMVETVFKTIKSELIWRTSFQSQAMRRLIKTFGPNQSGKSTTTTVANIPGERSAAQSEFAEMDTFPAIAPHPSDANENQSP